MRVLVGLGLLAGCYSPKAAAGAPCDLTAPACPTGQTCIAPGVCSAGPALVDARVDAPADASRDAGPDAPPDAQTRFTFTPTIVECLDPQAPDPAACATAAAPNGITVDADDTGHPWDAFIRVRIDATITGRTVTSLRLQLTASNDGTSDSDSSGEVYQVASFSTATLMTTEPAKTSGTPIAGDQGAVAPLQTIEWPLPVSLATPSTTLYLELESLSTDGADYWNLAGDTPPALIVDVQ